MAEILNFKKEFVERTMDIIDNCSHATDYEVTLLLNCLLGLVTLPIENEKNNDTNESQIFKDICVNKLDELSSSFKVKDGEEKNIFRNIRNAIAHLNIKIENSPYKNKIDSVTLINYKDKTITLEFTIKVDKLKEFAKFVANEYINRVFIRSKVL